MEPNPRKHYHQPNNKDKTMPIRAFVLILTLAACLGLAAPAHAQLSLNKLNDVSFDKIDFSGHTGVGNITMGSNGAITYGSNTSGSGYGTPGQIQIDAPAGTVVSIGCDATGSLSNSGTDRLTFSPVHFNVGSTNVTSYAAGTECAGIAQTVTTVTLSSVTAQNIIYIGGQLELNGQALASQSFASQSSGGTPPAFRILVQ